MPGRGRRRRPGPRTQARDRGSRRASVALSAHHRAETPFCGAARRRQAHRARRRYRARFTMSRRKSATTPGFPAYEMSNHARPGAECRHNLVYWRGAGICRHRSRRAWTPRLRRPPLATETEKRPEAWLMRVEALGHGLIGDEALTRERDGRRIPADGPPPRRRHRPGALRRLAGRALDPDAHRHPARRKARSKPRQADSCA